MRYETVLVLAPHTDDGEFGCGGTLARLSEEGKRIVYVAFSAAEQSVPKHLPRDILRHEVKDATRCLGVKPEDCLVLDFEVRRFPENRQMILDQLIKINSQYKPDLVFTPSLNDQHQDHLTIAQESFRAFKRTTLLAYEVPWNNLDFRTSCFFHLSEGHARKKLDAIACYKSQQHRNYASESMIFGWLKMRGMQIGTQYAETFEVVRWVNCL